MGDAGEGLVDAEGRAAERMAEREQEKKRRAERQKQADPETQKAVKSLELARAELLRQAEQTTNERRKEQIRQALADVETKLAAARSGAR